jgi:hypothetical protein
VTELLNLFLFLFLIENRTYLPTHKIILKSDITNYLKNKFYYYIMTDLMVKLEEVKEPLMKMLSVLKQHRYILKIYAGCVVPLMINYENLKNVCGNHLSDDFPNLFGITEQEGRLIRSYFQQDRQQVNGAYEQLSDILEGEQKSFLEKIKDSDLSSVKVLEQVPKYEKKNFENSNLLEALNSAFTPLRQKICLCGPIDYESFDKHGIQGEPFCLYWYIEQHSNFQHSLLRLNIEHKMFECTSEKYIPLLKKVASQFKGWNVKKVAVLK